MIEDVDLLKDFDFMKGLLQRKIKLWKVSKRLFVKLKKVIVVIMSISMLSGVSWSEDGIIPVKKGVQLIAPFEGRLVRQDIYERMVKCGLQLEAEAEKCNLDIEKEKKICEERVKAEKDICEMITNMLKSERDMFLKEMSRKDKWYNSQLVQFSLIGVITIGIVWGVSFAFR